MRAYSGPIGFTTNKHSTGPWRNMAYGTNPLWLNLHAYGRHHTDKEHLKDFIENRIRNMGAYLSGALNAFYPKCLLPADIEGLCPNTKNVVGNDVVNRNRGFVLRRQALSREKEATPDNASRRREPFLYAYAQIDDNIFSCELSVQMTALDRNYYNDSEGTYGRYKESSLAIIDDLFHQYGLPSPFSPEKSFMYVDLRPEEKMILARCGNVPHIYGSINIKDTVLGIQDKNLYYAAITRTRNQFFLMPESLPLPFGASSPKLDNGMESIDKEQGTDGMVR